MKKVLGLLALTSCGFEVVDTGYRGIETNFGKVIGDPLPEGMHFYNPFTSNIHEIEVREQKLEGQEQCFTKDTQNATISFAITYYPDPTKVNKLYQQFGDGWAEKIIKPAVIGSMKDAIGQYVADELVQKREAAKQSAQKEITTALQERGVIVTRLDFTNLDFDDAYEHAVEAKVKAVQEAAEAKNKTVQIEEEAKQQVLTAKAEAESMRIRSEALKQNKGLVEYEAVQKWDGKLPVNMYGSAPLPFLNLKGD